MYKRLFTVTESGGFEMSIDAHIIESATRNEVYKITTDI